MQPKQIMLVDDEPRLLAALRRRLSSSFDIVTFERGQAALDHLSRPHNIAVIVADMQMPEMNGVEFLTEVQKREPDIRRLMLTGNSDQETAVAAINEAKVLRFIRKPCDASDLKIVLNEALEEYDFNKTDLSKLKTQDQQSDKLGGAQQTFLSIMSDELRTPLSQIITISKILNETREQIAAETFNKFLRQITDSGETALCHIDRILNYTHLQASSGNDVEKQGVDIVALLNDEVAASDKQAKDKLVSISVESLRKSAIISAAPQEIMSAVREVLHNAIKFSDIGGHVSVILRCDKDNIAVRIANSGKSYDGMNYQETETAFQQNDAALKRTHSGVGLGLSLVKLIAQRHDMVFSVTPRNDGGSVATMVFKRSVGLVDSLTLVDAAA